MYKKIFFCFCDVLSVCITLFCVIMVLMFALILYIDTAGHLTGIKPFRDGGGAKFENIELTQEQWHENKNCNMSKAFTRDGGIYLEKQEKYTEGEVEKLRRTYLDLEGRAVNLDGKLSFGTEVYMFSGQFSNFHFYKLDKAVPGGKKINIEVTEADRVTERWIWNPYDQIFHGFSVDGKFLGYAGVNGIKAEQAEAGEFGRLNGIWGWVPMDTYNPQVFCFTEKGIFYLNFKKPQITPLAKLPGRKISSMTKHNWVSRQEFYGFGKDQSQAGYYDPLINIQTENNEFYIITEDIDCIRLQVPEGTYNAGACSIKGRLYAFAYTKEKMDAAEPDNESSGVIHNFGFYEVSKDGTMSRVNSVEYTCYPHQKIIPGKPAGPIRRYNIQKYSTLLAPAAMTGIWKAMIEPAVKAKGVNDNRARNTSEIFGYLVPYNLVWAGAVSFLMAAGAYWYCRSRCRGKADLTGWIVFVLLFNLAGLITCLITVGPARIKCHNCGKKRNLVSPGCIHCGSGLEKPETKQTDLILN
jgi:hypothetical protein